MMMMMMMMMREEKRLRVFENKVLRKIFGAKRSGVTGEWIEKRREEKRREEKRREEKRREEKRREEKRREERRGEERRGEERRGEERRGEERRGEERRGEERREERRGEERRGEEINITEPRTQGTTSGNPAAALMSTCRSRGERSSNQNEDLKRKLRIEALNTVLCPISVAIRMPNLISYRKQLKNIEASQRRMERKMLNITLRDRITNKQLQEFTASEYIGQRAATIKWKWQGHVARQRQDR
ncbi:hypothetical protein ANN_17171 [Periplaneta americana]|uniref:Uncharacterized protein n=1 Tax=Periplaneta americana TaxID=6978 RepID=A0ABQ8SS65_PERAM|nr:hypothetical protein ANN_17171 [Periplaneta americana]